MPVFNPFSYIASWFEPDHAPIDEINPPPEGYDNWTTYAMETQGATSVDTEVEQTIEQVQEMLDTGEDSDLDILIDQAPGVFKEHLQGLNKLLIGNLRISDALFLTGSYLLLKKIF